MWRRVVMCAFAGAALLPVLVGCGNSSPKDSSDWTYNPPEEFKQQDKQKNGATVFLGPADEGFTANLQVKAGSNPNDNAQKIGEDTLAKFKQGSDVTVKEQEPYALADSDGYTWMITKKMPSGVVAAERQFVVVKNKIVVLFTLASSEKSMEKWDQVLADSLKSFKWGRQ